MSSGTLPLATSSIGYNTNAVPNSVPLRDNSGGVTNSTNYQQSLQTSQSIYEPYKSVTTTYTITGVDATWFLCDATSGAFAITLPPVASFPNLRIIIIKIDSSGNAVTVTSASTEIIVVTGSAATTYALSARGNAVNIIDNTTNWYGLKS